MEKMDVITKMDKPTDWVTSLVIVEKRNGDLRICPDSRDLNKAIKRAFQVANQRIDNVAVCWSKVVQ